MTISECSDGRGSGGGRRGARIVIFTIAIATGGCIRPRSPADEAAAMERSRCGPDVEEASLAPVFDRSAIQGVEPLYAIAADADFGQQEEVTGAVVMCAP